MRRSILKAGVLGWLLTLVMTNAVAQSTFTFVQKLSGRLGELAPTSTKTVEDPLFFDGAYNTVLNKPYPTKSIISFGIDESVHLKSAQEDFWGVIQFSVEYTLANGSVVQETINAYVDYNAHEPHNYLFTRTKDNVYRVKVTITNLDNFDNFSVLKDRLVLTNELRSYRDFIFDCTNSAVQTINDSAWSSNTNKDELPVWWPMSAAAGEYDLEWTYIDSSALASGRYGSAVSPTAALLFENNATRVTITGTKYSIPLFYESKGHLFYRVRAVKNRPGGTRDESTWSSDYANGTGRFNFDGHERSLNWQSTISFAEEGKRKAVVQYFDGSLRGRQTVTKDNTTNHTIVAENFYDYQGRPVIQVLPAPTLSSMIGYTQNFNQGLNGSAYDKSSFDTLASASDYCSAFAPVMSSASGAAQYYSTNNPLKDSSFHKYIPDAGGFPFTEVEYAPDNTGRITRQSGVGPMYRLGGGHETKYAYGTPDQKELDALFGTEVGNYRHYFKSMVKDANGQYSVSYTDMRGRTIATALAGTPHDSIKLDKLASNVSRMLTENLADTSTAIVKDLVIENKKGLLVTKAGDHLFNYKLDPESLLAANCDQQQVCYDCLYDLRISITDDCNNQKLGGQPFDTVLHNFSIGSIDTSCANATGFNFSFSKYLTEGSYEITKQLSISRYGLDYYRDSVYLARQACISLDSFIREQNGLVAATLVCKPSCEQCTAFLAPGYEAFKTNFFQIAGIAPADQAGYEQMALDAYNKAKQECDELCGKVGDQEDIRKAMLLDLTPPSGQYANAGNDSSDIYSIFYIDQDSQTPDTVAIYRRVTNYTNEDNQQDWVFDEAAGAMVKPQDLSPEAFAQKFKLRWAEALLPYHPEHCKLEKYELLKTSHEWDRAVSSVETFVEARQKGYLNPSGLSSGVHQRFYVSGGTADPLYTLESSYFATAIKDSLEKYRSINSNNISLWGVATASVKCIGTNNTQACYTVASANPFDTTGLCKADLDMAWLTFRQMYLEVKKQLIQKWIKLPANCGSSVSSTVLIQKGHTPNFGEPADMIKDYGMTRPTDTVQAKQEAEQAMQSYYQSTCEGYAQSWFQQLSKCTQYDSADIVNIIIPELVQVCRDGSDIGHPLGSSSVKPSSTLVHRSFEEVIRAYNQAHGITDVFRCNSYGITAPKPYDQQDMFTAKKVYTRPDSCECANITASYNRYLPKASKYGTFSNYLQQVYNTTIADSILTQLRTSCNNALGSGSCNYFSEPITLPAVFQCYGGDVCADCNIVNTHYNDFKSKYPGIVPVKQTTDSVQVLRNKLFEQFMNSKLGFTKTSVQYLSFLDSCGDTQLTMPASQQQVIDSFNLSRSSGTSWFYNGAGLSLGNPYDFMDSGMVKIPDSLHSGEQGCCVSAVCNLNGICLTKGYSLEVRAKASVWNLVSMAVYSGDASNPAGFFTEFGSNSSVIYNNIFQDGRGWGTPTSGGLSAPGTLSDWHNLKIKVSLNGYEIYVDNQRINTFSRPAVDANKPIGHFGGYYIAFGSRKGLIEWTKLYDDTGNPVYYEEFNDPGALALVNGSAVCPAGNCSTDFANYYNQKFGTSYSYAQLDSIYWNDYGYELNVCAPTGDKLSLTTIRESFKQGYGENGNNFSGCDTTFINFFNQRKGTSLTKAQIAELYSQNHLRLDLCNGAFGQQPGTYDGDIALCGRTEILFEPNVYEEITACTDSTFFAVSRAMELYKYYVDSIKASFDNRYIAKCLNAYRYEKFTVTHQVSEYHYTLYYYDQAGNLVRTVAPAGVQPNYDSVWISGVEIARKNESYKVPAHTGATNYRYNTLNQVIGQKSPDGGQTNFWYDRLGRLALSRNAQQLAASNSTGRLFSYTRYDYLGRITEVGQLRDTSASNPVNQTFTRNETALTNWFTKLVKYRGQVTGTIYDQAYGGFGGGFDNRQLVQQKNLRSRVSYMSYTDSPGISTAYNQATFYSYDIHGNVDTLLQDYGQSEVYPNIMNKNGNRFKKMVYEYDLISGKVNKVMYQPGFEDQFTHRYSYDAENRLTDVETSLDGWIWEKDATYQYYAHGPLARMELGHNKVQGVDYAYTLDGWLKGINSSGASTTQDIGGDAVNGGRQQYTASDAIGLTLNYYGSDYKPISTAVSPFPQVSGALGANHRPLFNGNISSSSYYITQFEDPNTMGGAAPIFLYNYRYDQLNRLTGQDAHNSFTRSSNAWTANMTAVNSKRERIAYDANGNIIRYLRNSPYGNPAMDSLTYDYYQGTNRLRRIIDSIPAGTWTPPNSTLATDIRTQAIQNNYTYDAIGNLTSDDAENLHVISWNVYGKITELRRFSGWGERAQHIGYSYDAAGNRIESYIYKEGVHFAWYVRDAQGNIMSTYEASGDATDLAAYELHQTEKHIYGSGRLGVYSDWDGNVDNNQQGPATTDARNEMLYVRGLKQYELSNHLGNVLTTISDRKVGILKAGSSTEFGSYKPDIISATEYYPFGMVARTMQKGNMPIHRFGFNGKENDNLVEGLGAQQDYGMRIYDPRLGRFLSVDPISNKYPELTPYQFASNTPIQAIDLDGLEGFVATGINGHGMIISVEDARKGAPKVAEYSKAAAHSLVQDVKGLGKLKTYTDALDLFSLMFVPDVSSQMAENDQKRYETIQGGINTVKDIPNWGPNEWGSATGHMAFQLILAKTLKFAGGAAKSVSGTWVDESIAGWSERTIKYQEQITGVKAGKAYAIGDVRFDGERGNTLLEAKSSYDNFINKKTAEFEIWFVNNPKKGAPKLLDQAQRQIAAAKGRPIEWNFISQESLNATRSYFESQGLKSGIIYKYTPKK